MNFSKIFKQDTGLTLIELLVTIAVIAIVAAVTIPVASNIIGTTNDKAVAQTQVDVTTFVNKYKDSGAYSFDGTDTFVGYVDLNGNGSVDAGETIETLTIDTSRFAISASAGDAPTSAAGVDFATVAADVFTISSANGGAATQLVYSSADWATAQFQQNPTFASGSYMVMQGPSEALKTYVTGSSPSSVVVTATTGTYTITVNSSGYEASVDAVWLEFDGVVMDGNNLYNVTITGLDFS